MQMGLTSLETFLIPHYVPQFFLKNFASTLGKKKESTWVFQKSTSSTFHTNVKNIAKEKGYYDYPDSDSGRKIEGDLVKIEDKAAPIIARILDNRTLRCISGGHRSALSDFIITLHHRTPATRASIEAMDLLLKIHLSERGADLSHIKGYNEPLEPGAVGTNILRTSLKLAQLITKKAWLLMEAPVGSYFYCSDNPVTMANSLNPGDRTRSTIGLSVPGIEIYLPLSPKFCLAMFCPTIRDWINQNHQAQLHWRWVLGLQKSVGDFLSDYAEAINRGIPLVLDRENVRYLNSLQVSQSCNMLFSSINDFSLANEMIASNEKFRGPSTPVLAVRSDPEKELFHFMRTW